MVNINYDGTEVLISGTQEDHYHFCNILIYDYLRSNRKIKIENEKNKFYTTSINYIEINYIGFSHKLISVAIEDDRFIIIGDAKAFQKFRKLLISIADIGPGAEEDLFYYEGNNIFNETDLFFTFKVVSIDDNH